MKGMLHVAVDVLLATSKNALIELNGILKAEMRNKHDSVYSQFSIYFH